jgi:hypothetical protein
MADPLTIVNYTVIGLASGLVLAGALGELLGIGFFAISVGMLLIGEGRRRQLAKTPARASPHVVAGCAVCVVLVSLVGMVAMPRRAAVAAFKWRPRAL